MGYLTPNPLVTIKGKIKDLYIVEVNGKLLVKTCPRREPAEATAAQKPVREHLQAGNRFWKQVKANPELEKVYAGAAKAKRRRAVDLAKGDAMRPPAVTNVDLTGYVGEPAGIARVEAVDDFEVVTLHLRIRELNGALLEEGDAAFDTSTGSWVYAAKTAQPAGRAVVFEVTASDRPGNRVVRKVDHICGPRV